MKYWMIFMLVGLIHYNGFTQSNYQRIKVSHDIELVKFSENAYLHVSSSEIPGFGLVPAHGFKDSLQLHIGNKLIDFYYSLI